MLNILPGYGPTAGAALVEHPGVDKVKRGGAAVEAVGLWRLWGRKGGEGEGWGREQGGPDKL